MTETPEWFELTNNEENSSSNKPNKPKNPKKRIAKVLAFTVPLLIVGGAMVFAEGEGESDDMPPAPVIQTTTDASNQNSDQGATGTDSGNTSSSTTTKSANSTTAKAAGVANPATTSGKGVGVPKPKGGGEHEGREGHEGGEHEGGEHEGGEDD